MIKKVLELTIYPLRRFLQLVAALGDFGTRAKYRNWDRDLIIYLPKGSVDRYMPHRGDTLLNRLCRG